MHYYDVGIWQLGARIVFLDPRVTPLLDLAKENSGQRLRTELQFPCARDVIGGNHSAQDGREMERLDRDFRDLLVRHGHVGGAEINRSLRELADAAAGANGLVVDLRSAG